MSKYPGGGPQGPGAEPPTTNPASRAAALIEAVGLKEFEKTPYAARLKKTGVITSYICPLMYMNNPLSKAMPVITSSNKLRTYSTARYYTEDEIITMITKGAN